jgi:hypothetical protein
MNPFPPGYFGPNPPVVEVWICPTCHQHNRFDTVNGGYFCQNCNEPRPENPELSRLNLEQYWEQAQFGAYAEKKRWQELQQQKAIQEQLRAEEEERREQKRIDDLLHPNRDEE